ncbi:class I SAM-dependent methyltransferase [Streptomyces sp. NBC_00162]|uniref:class I SAM-dependent methyltransferase n=1 Tax=Streptomyces sp. NBC_00162 TaxID=2903629 RepID=UPI00214B0E3A|nr:class I SAM-dependent methyltransferase [Streptomyces sp. NBC_00162]UUU37475.1 methyltransferase domain-containing protein [Streptomyces sp. NBC_00162]
MGAAPARCAPRLEAAAEVRDLAEEFALDEQILSAVLDYVCRTTGLLIREDRCYRLAKACRPYHRVAFHLEKFLGAYGPAVARTDEVLQDPGTGPALRDLNALARAFGQLQPHTPSLTAQVLQAWDVTSLLDLGCGAGTLLIELASADPRFQGYGADAGQDMVRVANDRIHRAGLGHRLQVVLGDVRALGELTALPASEDVQALHGRSIMNEFFAGDGSSAIGVLAGLKARFPGRLLFLEDYYGRLTHDSPADGSHGHTLAQDLAQVLSGQGVPPLDLPGWAGVYQEADCTLVKAYEGDNDGVAWFIHVVAL